MGRLHDAVDRPLPEDHVVQSVVGTDRVGMRRRPGANTGAGISNARSAGRAGHLTGERGACSRTRDGERARPSHEERSRAHLPPLSGQQFVAQ